MKIRVSYVVDVEPDDVEDLVLFGLSLGLSPNGSNHHIVNQLLQRHGLHALELAQEAAARQRVELVEAEGGGQ